VADVGVGVADWRVGHVQLIVVMMGGKWRAQITRLLARGRLILLTTTVRGRPSYRRMTLLPFTWVDFESLVEDSNC
jgi:hypothetical protein